MTLSVAKDRLRASLNVETEIDDIAVLNNVFLAFKAQTTGRFDL